MKLRWRYRAYFFAILFNLILAALVISGAVFYVVHLKDGRNVRILEIRDSDSGRTYGRWSLEEGSEFAVEFIHSVHQSPVRETFVIEGEMIRLAALRFNSFGAGMPSVLEEGWTMGRDGDAILISGFNTSMRELNYTIGTVSNYLLLINGNVLSLQELAGLNPTGLNPSGINPGRANAHITIRLK